MAPKTGAQRTTAEGPTATAGVYEFIAWTSRLLVYMLRD